MEKSLLESLLKKHNSLVKDEYICDLNNFENWLLEDGNFDEKYIEISGNQTLSGHAEILDF